MRYLLEERGKSSCVVVQRNTSAKMEDRGKKETELRDGEEKEAQHCCQCGVLIYVVEKMVANGRTILLGINKEHTFP